MEKVKGCGKKVAEAGKTEKSKLDEIRTKSEWAEPTGAVLKVAANVASLLPPPAGDSVVGALDMGGPVNPDPMLADLRRAKEEVQEELRSSFKEAAQEISEMEDYLLVVRDGIEDLMEIITDKEF